MATSHHVPEMITPSKWDGWSFSKQPPPPSPTLQFNRFLGFEMTLTIFEKLKQNSRDWCIVKQHHPQIKGPCVRKISEDFSCMNWKFIRFRGWWLPLLCWYAMYTWQKMSSFFSPILLLCYWILQISSCLPTLLCGNSEFKQFCT